MGQSSQKKPAKLAQKLLAIRESLNLSQNELITTLGLEGELTQSQVSAFERGTRLPPLPILLKYARLVKVSTDVLIDDSAGLNPQDSG